MVTGLEFMLISKHKKVECKCDIESANENINKSIELHDEHMKNPDSVTDESQELLQDYIKIVRCYIKNCE